MSSDPIFRNSMGTCESQHFFGSAIDLADCIIALLNTKGCITFVNAFGARFFNASHDDLLGKSFVDLLIESGLQPVMDLPGIDHNCLEKTMLRFPGDHRQISFFLKNEERDLVHLQWQLSHHRGYDGAIIGKIAIGMPMALPADGKIDVDATSCDTVDLFVPTATDALPTVLTSANYRFMWEKSSVLHCILDFDGTVVHVNDGVATASGFDKVDLAGKTIFDLTPSEELGDLHRRLRIMRRYRNVHGARSSTTGYMTEFQIKILTRAGETRTILCSVGRQLIADNSGDLIGFHVAGIDITRLEAVNKDLRASEEKYRSFFDNGATMNIMVSFDGTILDVNDAIASIHGRKKSDLIGVSLFDLVPPELQADYKRTIARIRDLSIGGPQVSTIKVNDADLVASIPTATGIRYAAILKNVAVICEEGRPVAFLGCSLDITELETARQELAAHRDKLEALVEERTRALKTAQEELVKQERLAALGHLTATVSHELRNPLGTVSSSLYVIDKRTRGRVEGVETALDRARRSIRRCDGIIEELLNYTRDQAVTLEPTDLDTWLTDFLDELAIPKDVVLNRELAAQTQVPLDHEAFRRLMINLMDNALQSLVEDRPDRRVSVRTGCDETHALIRIEDTGAGMDSEQLSRIFEPLFSTKTFGIGLGLPIVKKITKQHGGEVAIESQPGEGTTATISIPRLPENWSKS